MTASRSLVPVTLRPIAISAITLLAGLVAPEHARSDTSPSDRTLVPGVRAGVITSQIAESRLVALVGRDRVQRVLYPNGEGGYYCATEVFPDAGQARPSASKVTVLWMSDRRTYLPPDGRARCDAAAQLMYPIEVVIEGKSTAWRTVEGLGLGVSLLDLERLNGRPVTFESCECCGDGGIGDWHGGRFGETISVEVDDSDVRERLGEFREDGVSSDELADDLKSQIRVKRIVLFFPAPPGSGS